MALSCGMNVLKILLFIFNFIFWLLGVAVLAVGIWSRVDGGSWETLVTDSTILNAANMMIASGVIVAIIGFLGCCGAIKKSECMLISYAILIFLIFILEIAAGIYAYSKKVDVQKDLEYNLEKAVNASYGEDTKSDEALTKAVDWFQQNVKCCGTKKPADWAGTQWFKTSKAKITNKRVPESCCIKKAKDCNYAKALDHLLDNNKIYEVGCVPAGKDFIKKHLLKIGGAAIGIGVIQLLGIIFAICLCRAIRDENKGATA